MGLVNVKRVADSFDISSAYGKGTVVKASIDLGAETEQKTSET